MVLARSVTEPGSSQVIGEKEPVVLNGHAQNFLVFGVALV
jgi:hypothetical protein